MTESEIMDALKICITKGASCSNCPAFVKVDKSRCKEVLAGALEILNRKNAENERLKYCNAANVACVATLLREKETARAEAIKEFSERVKEEFKDSWFFGRDAANSHIDQIAAEMGVE